MRDPIPPVIYVALGVDERDTGAFRVSLCGVFDEEVDARKALERHGFSRKHSNVVSCFRNAVHRIPSLLIVPEKAAAGQPETDAGAEGEG